ncbi:MAG TPA: ABC transporter permease subunit [Candidatus Sulfotelmatobacter sp.]|nr:ABC transporter permease subunit [Candidatus Sulfotelmatobacter sp.]
MREHPYLSAGAEARALVPNRWDVVAIPLLFLVVFAVFIGVKQASAPIQMLQTTEISLDPWYLPDYALRTTLRMLAGLVCSLLFTLVYGTLAAKSRRLELVLVPILDVLQSVPVLGYLSFTVTFFLGLFPGSVAGAECAAIFAIFTAQAWNMTFSFYQSLRTIPADLDEACRSFRLGAWQRFWRLEVPYAMPGLIWNMMMSMSGAWFFVVASEAISVGDKQITLPGIGAYVAEALKEKSLAADGWAIFAMIIVIMLYDQLMFRPLVAWADKFRMETVSSAMAPESWLLDLLQRTRVLKALTRPVGQVVDLAIHARFAAPRLGARSLWRLAPPERALDYIWFAFLAAVALYAARAVVHFVAASLGWQDFWTVLRLGFYTLARVVVLIAIASLVWVPLGVMIGLRPRIAEKVQPLAQFLAAFPANLLFPIPVGFIVAYGLNPDIWLTPLMLLGAQWYIVFNVIAGGTAFPTDFIEASKNFRIRGWLWWRKVMLPGIFPYFITGAITASGGAWNASIVTEVVNWGDQKLAAHGLGAYIAQMTDAGDYPRIVLGIVVMSAFVTLFNRLLWRPLYEFSARRMRLN